VAGSPAVGMKAGEPTDLSAGLPAEGMEA